MIIDNFRILKYDEIKDLFNQRSAIYNLDAMDKINS